MVAVLMKCVCTCVHAWFNWDTTSLECVTDSSFQIACWHCEISDQFWEKDNIYGWLFVTMLQTRDDS